MDTQEDYHKKNKEIAFGLVITIIFVSFFGFVKYSMDKDLCGMSIASYPVERTWIEQETYSRGFVHSYHYIRIGGEVYTVDIDDWSRADIGDVVSGTLTTCTYGHRWDPDWSTLK